MKVHLKLECLPDDISNRAVETDQQLHEKATVSGNNPFRLLLTNNVREALVCPRDKGSWLYNDFLKSVKTEAKIKIKPKK